MTTRRFLLVLVTLVVSLGGCVALSLFWRLATVPEEVQETILWLRSYRLAIGGLAGMNLAVAGVLMQGLFRNPLADPGIIGAGAGASFTGLLGLLFWRQIMQDFLPGMSPELIIPLFSLFGALAAMALVLALLQRTRSVLVVLLFGVVLTLFLSGLGSLVRHMVQEDWELARALQGFMAGDIGDKGWRHVLLLLPLTTAMVIMSWSWAPHMNLLQSGEDEAASLGLSVQATQRWLIVWAAVGVAGAVAVAGNVAFVGLLVPHLCRQVIGNDHRFLVPTAALAGMVFVVACDFLGRLPVTAGALPFGVVTGLVGAPVFLFLLMRRSKRGVVWS
jgi:iron complex transport system permease protein